MKYIGRFERKRKPNPAGGTSDSSMDPGSASPEGTSGAKMTQ